MQRVTDLADSNRCKSSGPSGQCLNRAEDGSNYCTCHCGVNQAPARQLRKYMLATAEDQGLLDRYTDDAELKSLREEIALTRVMIQNVVRAAKTEAEKINAYSRVNSYMLTLERLMKTGHSLDQSLGQLVGKADLLALGKQLYQIVIDRLVGVSNYEQLVDAIISDMDRAFHNIGNKELEAEVRPE
jgi:hypothetical protein